MPLGQVLQRWSHRLRVQSFCKLAHALQVYPALRIKIASNCFQKDHILPHGNQKRHSPATVRKPDYYASFAPKILAND